MGFFKNKHISKRNGKRKNKDNGQSNKAAVRCQVALIIIKILYLIWKIMSNLIRGEDL